MKKNILTALFTISAMALVVLGGYSAQNVTAAKMSSADQEYDKYQNILYTDAAGNTTPVLVRANEEETEFNLQFDYYGLDADLCGVKTGDNQYHITNGEFFQTNGQAILEKAAEIDNWIEIR